VAVPVASAHRFVRGHLLVIGANCEAAVDRGLPLLACATPPRHDRAPAQMTTAHRCGAPAKDEESRAVAATTQQTLRGSTTQLRRKPNNPCNFFATYVCRFLLSSPLRVRRLESNRIANFFFSVDRVDSPQKA